MARNPADEASSTSSNIIWLQDAHPRQLDQVGYKALNLAVAQRLGLDVLPGFVVTTAAYRQCLAQTGIYPEQLPHLSYEEALQTARTIQHYLFKQSIPSEVLTDIRSAYKQLTTIQPGAVVLRPSVAYGSGIEFAKRLRPILGVKSLIELEKALKMAWTYMWLDDIVQYRFEHDSLRSNWTDLALLIQPLQVPYVSGSAMTYSPAFDERAFVLESARGLNEAVSRGVIVPDHFVWDRTGKKAAGRQIANKPLRFVMAEHWSVQEVAIETSQRNQPSLGDSDLETLAEAGEKLLSGYKRHVEFEWFKAPQGLVILQVMPVSAPDFQSMHLENWLNPNSYAPYFEKPLSPFGWSLLEPLLTQAFERLYTDLEIEQPVPQPAFQLHDYQVNMHPELLAAFQECLNTVWQSLEGGHAYLRYLRFLWRLRPWQQQWSKVYQHFSQTLAQEWQHQYEGWGAEQLLTTFEQLQELGVSWLQHALLVRLLQHLTGVLFSDYAQQFLPADQDYSLLFQGLDSRYAQTAQLLDGYLEQIAAQPQWAALFNEGNAQQIAAELQMSENGKVWLQQLLADFAKNGFFRVGLEPLYPDWTEAPQVLLKELKEGLQQEKPYWNPQLQHERESLEAHLLACFDWTQLPQRFFYQSLLHLAQSYTAQVEEEPFYLSMWIPRVRSLILALARYLPLDSRQDIFYLSLAEIREMIQNPMNAYKIKSLRELIQARKYKRRITHRLGSESTGELKALELKGLPAAQGEVLGRVRVVTRSEDLKALQPDEIIVTDYFEPFWEQALAKAGGLIMELGGVMSHGAMLARHYGIPAVAAVPKATQQLKNGLIARIDGRKGHILAYREEALESQEAFVG